MRKRLASMAQRYERWERRSVARFADWSTRRRWVVFVAVPLLLFGCCGGVAGVPLAWLARETVKAGRGAPTPDAAADSYLMALSSNNQDGLLPLLDDEHQAVLLAQWRAYRQAMDGTDPKPFRLDYARLSVAPAAAGRAEVRVDVTATWWAADSSGRVNGYTSDAYTWVIATGEDDGWRVMAVQAPAWCGGYVRADACVTK
jgi:hypothetical protein